MDYKFVLGVVATILAFIGYVPYFCDIFANKTKPHAFSWLIWGILTAIVFAGQIVGGGGPGAWVTGAMSITSFLVFIAGLVKGRENIEFIDWFSLIGAGIALLFWFVTKNPLIAVILITLIDAIGFIPTFRKSYFKPREETMITYFLDGFEFLLALFALEKFTLVTSLYPISLVVTNWVFIGFLYIRRKQLI